MKPVRYNLGISVFGQAEGEWGRVLTQRMLFELFVLSLCELTMGPGPWGQVAFHRHGFGCVCVGVCFRLAQYFVIFPFRYQTHRQSVVPLHEVSGEEHWLV